MTVNFYPYGPYRPGDVNQWGDVPDMRSYLASMYKPGLFGGGGMPIMRRRRMKGHRFTGSGMRVKKGTKSRKGKSKARRKSTKGKRRKSLKC